MSIRNVWLLGLVVLTLIFGGAINTYAQLDNIEAYDIDGKTTGDEYSIRGVRVLVEGDCNVEKGDVGILQMAKQGGGSVLINSTASFASGGNELDGLEGTTIRNSDKHIIANIDGKYAVTFVIPLNILTAAKPTTNGSGEFFSTSISFTGGAVVGQGSLPYKIQTPRFNEVKLNVDLEDVVKPGDMIEFSIEMQTDTATLGKEIRLLTMLPDLSELDSEFVYTDGIPNSFTKLKNLANAVKIAVNKGRLIISQDDEDYTIRYFISQTNTKSPGFKNINIYAIDFPAILNISNIDAVFTAFGLSFSGLHIASWHTAIRGEAINQTVFSINDADKDGDLDSDLINYDGTPPNFDFVMVNPFNTPKAVWNDVNGNGQIDASEWDHVSYVYKEGDTISIWIQLDPHDFSIDELRNVGDVVGWVLPGDSLEDMRVDNLTIIGDLSGLMDPAKISATDSNLNGIPDEAEVPGVALGTLTNLGTNGTDDDLDGDGEFEDDQDSTANGFYEPISFEFKFPVTAKFLGAKDRGLTIRPFRFYVRDSVGNVKHYSAWRETYDTVDKKWNEVGINQWIGPNGRSDDFVNGERYPANLDNADGDEQIYPALGPLASYPVPALFPQWTSGFKIVSMWANPWTIAIDGSAPTVSVISGLYMNRGTEAPGDPTKPDPSVAMGAAVVPEKVGYEPADYEPTILKPLASATANLLTNTQFGGNFIYEVSGNELNLITMKIETPSDNDVSLIKLMISDTGAPGTFVPMKGVIKGDVDNSIIDFAGNVTDEGRPGVSKQSNYHNGYDGNDDKDDEADFSDKEVLAAMTHVGTDNVDNDADGLTDAEDVDADGNSMELYIPSRDEGENAIMDEGEAVIRVKPGSKITYYTFDPVRLARTLKLQPGKPYVIKALAIDNAGASSIDASAPLYIVFNVTGKGITAPTGTAKAALSSKAGVAVVTPTIPENMEYFLSSTITGAVSTVTLQYSNNKRDWVTINGNFAIPNPDEVVPFRATWKPIISEINTQLAAFGGYRAGEPLYMRASGQKLGKLGKYKVINSLTLDPVLFSYYDPIVSASDVVASNVPDITIAITDSTAPVMVVYSAGGDDNLSDGALVPVAKDVLLKAMLISPVDAILAIDSTNNMATNDPTNLRRAAAKLFIDLLNPMTDQVGVIGWDSIIENRVDLIGGVAGFQSAKNAIDLIDASGITNLVLPLDTAMGMLNTGGRAGTQKVVVLLTDADSLDLVDPQDGPLAVHAKALELAAKGYKVFVIGLRNTSPSKDIFRDIADTTGGVYYETPLAEYLMAVYQMASGQSNAHDVKRAIFQYAEVYPDGATANWIDVPGTVDLTILPGGSLIAVSKWDTTAYVTGNVSKRANIRCVAEDVSGNSDPQLAPIAHVVVGKGKYAAFVVDPINGSTITPDNSGKGFIIANIYNRSSDIASIARVVFQARKAGTTAWFNFDDVAASDLVYADGHGVQINLTVSSWYATWDIRDVDGQYSVRAIVYDDKGYVNEGLEVSYTVKGTSGNRAKISNFVSTATTNPIISKYIARAGKNPDVWIDNNWGNSNDKLIVRLKAEVVSGSVPQIKFQYKINELSAPTNPKQDTGWTDIAVDTSGGDGWFVDWTITNTALIDSLVAKIVYVRAVAWSGSVALDRYVDEGNYVPYAGLKFEEMQNPTAVVERIEVVRDGVTKDIVAYDPKTIEKEIRITGGTLNFIPFITDQGTADHRMSGVTKVELFYKLYYLDSYTATPTTNWVKGPEDTEAPFMISWDITNIPSAKYEVLLVATDQVGNRSANIYDTNAHLRALQFEVSTNPSQYIKYLKIVDVDREGPSAYIEDPDVTHNGTRIWRDSGGNGKLTVAVGSSCNGGIQLVKLYYSLTLAIPPETRTGTGEYTFDYLDANGNGQYDVGELYWIRNPPGQGTGIPGQPSAGTPTWVEIQTVAVNYAVSPFTFPAGTIARSAFTHLGPKTFAGADAVTGVSTTEQYYYGYYYYDSNSNGAYDVGEAVWEDIEAPGGNIGRYNNHPRTISERRVLGSVIPPDETLGTALGTLGTAALAKAQGCTGKVTPVVKWVDLEDDGDGFPELSIGDFIWIDSDGNGLFSYSNGTMSSYGVLPSPTGPDPNGIAEPLIYVPIGMTWANSQMWDLPPTNYSAFDLKAEAQDRNDVVSNAGNWGLPYIGTVRITNILTQITAINGKAVVDFKDALMRTTGGTAEVTVRTWPRPIGSAKVQLWLRYDDGIYPGGKDFNYNGLPDNGTVINSRSDGIDNDWDGVVDNDLRDPGAKVAGEVNKWKLASTTGGTTMTAQGGDAANKWFETKLVWDISALKDEFQFEIVPIIVDGQNYGVNFNYASTDTGWSRSPATFPQGASLIDGVNNDFDGTTDESTFITSGAEQYLTDGEFVKIIVDHLGPYSFAQVVKNTDGIAANERTLDSWSPLTNGSPDDLIIRHNDGIDNNGNGVVDEPGENNWITYDLQAKTVSIFGGLSYTKSFGDTVGGVEFQYRTAGGTWTSLGFDYDPDYMSTYVYNSTTGLMEAEGSPNADRGLANSLGWVGTLIEYRGRIDDRDLASTADLKITSKTQRIVVATWSIDNLPSILNTTLFPYTNGTEYEFRVIAKDLADSYSNPGIATSGTATDYDNRVVKGIVGVDGRFVASPAAAPEDFLRGIDWKSGAPFMLNMPSASVATKDGIFTQPAGNSAGGVDYVLGPRNDGYDTNYWVDNLVPKASIIQVDESKYAWTPDAGVDPNAIAAAIDANVMEGDDVLVEAIVNADPEKRLSGSVWGVAGDITEVRLYGKSANSGWKLVGMGTLVNNVGTIPSNEYANKYTFRIDTEYLVQQMGLASTGNRDVTLMAFAKDDNGNEEAMEGEIVIRVNDMLGPKVRLGGLALDMNHISNAIDRVGGAITGISGFASGYLSNISNSYTGGSGSIFGDPKFVDTVNLDLNNFGNGVFPADLYGDYQLGSVKRATLKVSGEKLDLYAYNQRMAIGEIPSTGITVSVLDKNNTPVFKKAMSYSVDVTNADGSVTPAKVPQQFTLSENTARVYLPTWVENGKTVSRFEGVKLFYAVANNVANTGIPSSVMPSLLPSGSSVAPPALPFGSSVNMVSSFNSKGEPIWTVSMDLEAGKTYFYYFVVDTVGDTWVIPDPKNLMFDEGLGAMAAWWTSSAQYIITKNLFINLPLISKIWVPGTPGPAGDEIWFTRVPLDGLADGGYEIRVEVTDSAGYKNPIAVSKTIVLDRTPPPIDAAADIKVAGRVKANSVTEATAPRITAILHDGAGINALQTYGVLFEISRESRSHKGGNTADATSVWTYAFSPQDRSVVSPGINDMIKTIVGVDINQNATNFGINFNWLKKLALDLDETDGWSVPWATPNTDQNFKYYVRAVPFDDAFNVQVDQTNQVEVWVDGTVPKAKVLTASLVRGGSTITDGADGFEIQPTDGNVTLTARIDANSDGDLNLDGIIDAGSGEDVNRGVKNVQFEYTLRELKSLQTSADIQWYKIASTQYSQPVLAPNADGSWQVTWQVDFSKLYNKDRDQYIYVRAVAEDEVGNIDDVDPILAVMVLNDVTGPAVQIREIKGPLCTTPQNALSPHLAVSRGIVEVGIKTRTSVAAIKLNYRAVGETNWKEVKAVSRTTTDPIIKINWDTSRLEAGRYELQAIGYDSDGNPTPDPFSVIVVLDYAEPIVTIKSIATDNNRDAADGYEKAVDLSTGIYRYAQPSYAYFNTIIKAKVDATEPVDKVEAKSVVLQYFDRSSAQWKDVIMAMTMTDPTLGVAGQPANFVYNKTNDEWTLELKGIYPDGSTGNALGMLLPGFKYGVDGEIWLRALATDYACNANRLDKGTKIIGDANPPEVIAVYSGGISYEGGADPTIISKGGDPVELWAKVRDSGVGVGSITYKYISKNAITPAPPYGNAYANIANGAKFATNGDEETWRYEWATPKNMPAANEEYTIAIIATDKAGNSVDTSSPLAQVARVKVEKDVTAPVAPILSFFDTFAPQALQGTPPANSTYYDTMGGYESVPVLNEFNASAYTKKRLPLEGANADKYEVFSTYSIDADANGVEDNVADTKKDTSVVIFVRTQKPEYGSQIGTDRDPSLSGTAGMIIDWGYDPNQDGDSSDIVTWNQIWNSSARADATHRPLVANQDIRRIPIRDGAGAVIGYNYYWPLGDRSSGVVPVDNTNEEILNTYGLADGIYFVRAQTTDANGVVGPWGYGKFRVNNVDDIVPARTSIYALNTTTDTTKWVPLEWKWHYVTVRTQRNQVGLWWFGGSPNPSNDADRTKFRFFNDIKTVIVEAFDNESNTWVNVTKDGGVSLANPISATVNNNKWKGTDNNGNASEFLAEWVIPIDSTLVGDGNTKMRAYAVDNRAFAEAKDATKEKAIMIDNPRATVVLPASGEIAERGVTTLAIQAVPIELAGWDTAKNGDDVGQISFLVRRKKAPANASYPSGGINGPYILVDAKDDDLDGLFGEDPVLGKDYDKDGKIGPDGRVGGEDGVSPSDTNEPYMVFWKLPDWLVIDDPQTESTIEQTADYYVMGVAGDSNTGPLDKKIAGGTTAVPQDISIGTFSDGLMTFTGGKMPIDQIHWDNPSHIYSRTTRAALITVVDNHPPRTRVLQVDKYKIPSEVKIVVGKTVTVFSGDTEVDWVPPGTFAAPDWSKYLPIGPALASAIWPADAAAWSYGMLYPNIYDPDTVWVKELYTPSIGFPYSGPGKPAEYRANGRVSLRYAGPYTDDATAPAFPTSGQTWADTAWKTAEADAIHLDDTNATGDPAGSGNPGIPHPNKPNWKVTNWTTGGPVLPDGKYFITVTGTDDVNHTTGIPVGTAEVVMPDIATIWIKNTVKPIVLAASQLLVTGELKPIANKEMERGEPLVLSVDPKMAAEDLSNVVFQFKAQHDYDWKTIPHPTASSMSVPAGSQPYSVTLDPRGKWDGVTGNPANIVLGAIYQFKAVGYDQIGNAIDSNIIELVVVDKVAMASIAMLVRIPDQPGSFPGTINYDEAVIMPTQLMQPTPVKLTGKIHVLGLTDADTVSVTFQYRAKGATAWTDIKAIFNRILDTTSPNIDPVTGLPTTDWVKIWNNLGYNYSGTVDWSTTWDTTTLTNGLYEMAVVANTGDNKSAKSNILTVEIDHNAYDIFDGMTDSSPKNGQAVGGWTRRPVTSQNPILDPDQKEELPGRGEVDVWAEFGKGFKDLDMGIPTSGNPQETALMPSLTFEYKPSAMPNVGDQTKDDANFWKPIDDTYNIGDIRTTSEGDHVGSMRTVFFDAATKRFSTVWHTAVRFSAPDPEYPEEGVSITSGVLNGYYDIRVKVVDEAGNIAYKIIAERVVVDNTAPDAKITNINGDTTLSHHPATDTELPKDAKVVVRATVVDSLTSVAAVQFQVMINSLQSGKSTAGNGDEQTNSAYADLGTWMDIGLATKDSDPKDSYSLLWDTTGLFEGDYSIRAKVYDVLGNMSYAPPVHVTVIDTTPPVASIVGYYPSQLHFLNWPKKYWLDTVYAATICQADIQEVQFQYRNATNANWTNLGIPMTYPIDELDTIGDKLNKVAIPAVIKKNIFPEKVARNDGIYELFDWTGLWATTWDPKLPDGKYQLRAIAKDWSGNVDPSLAPILTVSVANGQVKPETPGSGISVEFSANLGGNGIGDRSGQWANGNPVAANSANYTDVPSLVVTVDAPIDMPDEPIVLMLAEFNAPEGLAFGGGIVNPDPNGLVIAGELLDMKPVQGEPGKYRAALMGDELPVCQLGGRVITYLDLLRLGGKLVVFVTTNNGIVGTSLMMDDIKVYPITPELGTNGTVGSKDGLAKVTVPRAALVEPQPIAGGTYIAKLGLLITPAITPNTPKDQRLVLEPVGTPYSIEFFDYWTGTNADGTWQRIWGFRPGFEPRITIDYSGFDIPADAEAKGFISVRYWDPQPSGSASDFGGRWANDDIINLSINAKTKTASFNLKKFGNWSTGGVKNPDGTVSVIKHLVPHSIFSIVLEKSIGRVDNITIYYPPPPPPQPQPTQNSQVIWYGFGRTAFKYQAEPGISYVDDLDDARIYFRISDPAGVDESSIRLYIDGVLMASGMGDIRLEPGMPILETERIYYFCVPRGFDLIEGIHTIRVEAWDKSDAIDERNWLMLDASHKFYWDTTPPQVVTFAAQKDGLRYFRSVDGATAAITIVDEGVGLSAAELQRTITVDVFKWLTPQTTNLRSTDQGNVINYQRKTLVATSKPIVEYTDTYTPDGVDNEKWTGIQDGASLQRHKAWRASYTLQVGQVTDGETYEIVFYAQKPNPMVIDLHNENAVYLYEDLTKAYLAVWKGDTADNLSVSTDKTLMGIVAVPATQVPDFLKLGILNLITTADPFMGYYQGSFLEDILGNGDTNGFVKQLTLPNLGNILNAANATDAGQAIGAVSSTITSSSSSGSNLSYSVPSFFVRQLVADTRGPVTTLDIPQGVKASDPASTVSATIIDDGSGIANAKLIINGKVVAEKKGPISNVTLDYTFGKGEVVGATEIKVVVIDQAGNETVTRGSFGVQEMNAPVIGNDAGPSGDNVKTAYPTISASYSDESGIDMSSVVLTLNGAVLTDATVTPSKVSYTPTSPLKAGVVYTARLSIKDKTGVTSEKSWTFKLEEVAPSVTDTTPTAIDKTGMPVISAKFGDGDGTGINKDSVKLTIDKTAVDALVTDKSVSYKSPVVMAKGKHTADLSVADVAGNLKVQSWEFSIEEELPVITDVLPAGDINTDMPVLSAKFSDAGVGVDLKAVSMTLNGALVSATVGEANVSFAVTEPLKPNVGYIVGIRVADKAGNLATASSNFKLETTKPAISGNTPTGTINSIDVAVAANYSDAGIGIDIKSALMKLDGVVVPANASASGIAYQAQKLTRGDHAVYVEVADKFGNPFSLSWSFKVEETPPVISLVEPKGEITTATPVLKATYSDAGTGINVASVVLSINGQIVPAIATASQVSYDILNPLEKNTTYKVSVQVADKAGNIASADSSFSLETTAPTVSNTKPTGAVSETDAAKGIMVTADLADAGSGVNPASAKMWVDGSPVMVTATDKAASHTAKGLGYGQHTVRLVVADMLANTADKSWTFSVGDSTKPTVTVLSPKENQTVGVKPIIRISYADEGSGVDLTSIAVKIDDKPVSAGAMAPAKPGDSKVVSAGESSYEVKLAFGWHTLTVSVKDVAGNEETAEVKFMVEGDVLNIVKAHNYPNPVTGGNTKIAFGLSKKARVSIKVYDFTNTLVATVTDGDVETEATEKAEFSWDGMTGAGGRQLATGVYFCQVVTKTDNETKSQIIKVALVRE